MDPAHAGAVYVAESTATARRIVLEVGEQRRIDTLKALRETSNSVCPQTKEVSPPFAGATAPLTCLALFPEHSPTILFAGSWDRVIHSWSIPQRSPQRKFAGHGDFIKCLALTRLSHTGAEVLISGGADGRIIVWDIHTGNKLHVLKPHLRGVLDLAVLPPHFWSESGSAGTVFGAGNVGEIRRFGLTPEKVEEIKPEEPIHVHETSIYQLLFDADGDLWTASADGDVVCLGREKGWAEEMRIRTGGWTRAVGIDEVGGWVLSGGRDEDVKVWERGTGKLHHTFSGHYDEITGLVLLGQVLVTISLDGTIRQWSLKPTDLQAARTEAAEKEKSGDEWGKEDRVPERGDTVEHTLVTEEEERELAELLEGDD